MDVVFWILVGLFVGWNLPQPAWAKSLQEKVRTTVKGWANKED